MPLIDRHILWEWLKIFAMSLLAMIGMLLISAVYNNLEDLLVWNVPTLQSVEFFAMIAMGFLPVVIPVSLLVSLLFMLGHLHKNQELTAMRAAGLGIFRITRSLWAAGAVLSFLMLALNASLVPYATERAATILSEGELKYRESKGDFNRASVRGEMLFFNNSADRRNWYIANYNPYTRKAYGVNIYTYDERGRITNALVAETGSFDEATRTWTLKNGKELVYEDGQLLRQPKFTERKESKFSENPSLMALIGRKTSDLSIPEIRRILKETDPKSNPRISEYEVYYNSVLASPFCCLIVVGIAIPFAVAGVRVNPMVGVSKSIGLFAAYYLLTNIFNMLGTAQWLPPVLAAWAPNVLMFAYAVYLCRKVN
ncbi:MAG: LptF/LptG family permease [Opitutales bacterium]|nr:LptF/LptG family permease [Opitutales bacterium]